MDDLGKFLFAILTLIFLKNLGERDLEKDTLSFGCFNSGLAIPKSRDRASVSVAGTSVRNNFV